MQRRAWIVIAVHEYVTNVRRKEFILITLGLPVLMMLMGGLSIAGTTAATGVFQDHRTHVVAVIDPAGALRIDDSEGALPGIHVVPCRDIATGQSAVRAGRFSALVVLDRNYVRTGEVTVYRVGGSILNKGDQIPLGAILTQGLLSHAGAAPEIIQRAVSPTGEEGARVLVLNRSRRFVRRSLGQEAARFAVPYAFTLLLTMSIFISANYLLRGIADEKENRVIEVILSSVTPEDLLRGKLVGLAGVGLTQVGIWIGLAAVPAMIRFSAYIHLSGVTLIYVALFFGLGFGLYAALMAGLGALGTSYRETQQIAGGVSIFAFFPLAFIPLLIEYPNGMLARMFSYVPFTAPTTMVLRLTAGDVPLVDVACSAAAIVLATWLVQKVSARLFRFGLLIYGKRPTMLQTLRCLRNA